MNLTTSTGPALDGGGPIDPSKNMPPSTLEWVERVRQVNRLSASHTGQGPSLLSRARAHAPTSLTTRSPIVPPSTHDVEEGAFMVDNNIISINVSDGDESRRPPPDHHDNTKFSVFKPMALDDKVSTRWRRTIGKHLAVETLKKVLNGMFMNVDIMFRCWLLICHFHSQRASMDTQTIPKRICII